MDYLKRRRKTEHNLFFGCEIQEVFAGFGGDKEGTCETDDLPGLGEVFGAKEGLDKRVGGVDRDEIGGGEAREFERVGGAGVVRLGEGDGRGTG